jgi:integrase
MAQVIFRRGRWYSDFRLKGRGRVRRPLSKDKREAQVELGKLIERLRGEAKGEAEKNISWPRFKERYEEHIGAKKPATQSRDRAAIAALEREFPLHALAQMTPDLLDRFKARRLAAGTGKATVARDVSALKAMMHKAEDWGYSARQKWATVKKPKVARKKLYFHTPEEFGRLLSRTSGHWRLVALLAARAGLRREEIHTLTWEDVDFERNRIHVVPKEVAPGVSWEPKDYEQRFIPMAQDLREALEAARKRAKARWVVIQGDGERPSLAVMTAYMRKVAKRAGLRGSIHILRHTFGSHLAQAGVPLKTIKDLMGHADMSTTEIYAELLPENLEDAVARLPLVQPAKFTPGKPGPKPGFRRGFRSKRL